MLPIVPPLWDEVSAAAGAGPKWGIDSYPAGGFPWFKLEPKAAELAEDNGWLLSFSVKAVVMATGEGTRWVKFQKKEP